MNGKKFKNNLYSHYGRSTMDYAKEFAWIDIMDDRLPEHMFKRLKKRWFRYFQFNKRTGKNLTRHQRKMGHIVTGKQIGRAHV